MQGAAGHWDRRRAIVAVIAAYLALAAGLLPWAAQPGPELVGLIRFLWREWLQSSRP